MKPYEAARHVAADLQRRGMLSESRDLEATIQAGSVRREVGEAVAAEILHVPAQTIRNWVRRGMLPGRFDENDDLQIPAQTLEPALELDRAMPCCPASVEEISIDQILDAIDAYRAEQSAK